MRCSAFPKLSKENIRTPCLKEQGRHGLTARDWFSQHYTGKENGEVRDVALLREHDLLFGSRRRLRLYFR